MTRAELLDAIDAHVETLVDLRTPELRTANATLRTKLERAQIEIARLRGDPTYYGGGGFDDLLMDLEKAWRAPVDTYHREDFRRAEAADHRAEEAVRDYVFGITSENARLREGLKAAARLLRDRGEYECQSCGRHAWTCLDLILDRRHCDSCLDPDRRRNPRHMTENDDAPLLRAVEAALGHGLFAPKDGETTP